MSPRGDFDGPAAVELILPANVIETCYNLKPGKRVEFITANLEENYTNHVHVVKLRDFSVKLKVSGIFRIVNFFFSLFNV